MQIAVYIPDASYISYGGDKDLADADFRKDDVSGLTEIEATERASVRFRSHIQNEYDCRFAIVNIGPGADLPAFVTWLNLSTLSPYVAAIFAAFLLGKPVKDSFEVFKEVFNWISKFADRNPYLNRDAASVIALRALVEKRGSAPTNFRIVGYETSVPVEGLREDIKTFDFSQVNKLYGQPDPLYLMQTVHVFVMEADGVNYGILTYRQAVEIKELSEASH